MAEVKDMLDWYTVPEAARYLGVPERWVRRQIENRHIRNSKIGGKIRFLQSDLDALLAESFREATNGPPIRPGRPRRARA